MKDLETLLRNLIREEFQLVFEEMLPRLSSQPLTKQLEPEVPLLLSAREAAKRLSISERTLYTLSKTGQLPYVRVGSAKRFSVETIAKWIQLSEAEPDRASNSLFRDPSPKSRRSTGQQEEKRKDRKNVRVKPKSRKVSALRTSVRTTAVPERLEDKEQLPNPLELLLDGIGVDHDVVSAMTFGDLMRIAGVDIPTFHGWRFLGRSMPEEAIERLKEHFQQLPSRRSHVLSPTTNSSASD